MEMMVEAFLPVGPSNVNPRSLLPSMKVKVRFSVLPSGCLNSKTELRVLPRAAGNAPVITSTSRMKLTLIMPTGPPLEPCVLKWLIVGTSMPSR